MARLHWICGAVDSRRAIGLALEAARSGDVLVVCGPAAHLLPAARPEALARDVDVVWLDEAGASTVPEWVVPIDMPGIVCRFAELEGSITWN